MHYAITFYIKGGRIVNRKGTYRDVAKLTEDWQLDPATRTIAMNFEHNDSPPILINLDVLEYIDFREVAR